MPGLPGACGSVGEKAEVSEMLPPTGAGRAPSNKAPLKSSPAPNLAHSLPLPTKHALSPTLHRLCSPRKPRAVTVPREHVRVSHRTSPHLDAMVPTTHTVTSVQKTGILTGKRFYVRVKVGEGPPPQRPRANSRQLSTFSAGGHASPVLPGPPTAAKPLTAQAPPLGRAPGTGHLRGLTAQSHLQP